MPEQFTPREVYRVARAVLGPHLAEQGYRRTKKTGPGPSWERDTGAGSVLVGVHAGSYSDLLGGKFQVELEVESSPLLDGNLLWLLDDEQLVAWRDLAWPVYGRALGLLPGGDAGPDLQEDRRQVYDAIGVTDWDSTEPGLGFPWFTPEDLGPEFEFITQVLPAAESRLLGRAAPS